jgi:hypothetical protein
MKDIDWDT